jgi:hypothetical protein
MNMNSTLIRTLIRSESPLKIPPTLKAYYFFKQEETEKRLYMLEILGSNDALGIFDSGEMWGYELKEQNYFGEYRDHVDLGAYKAITDEGFIEISKEEFMRLVEEKYPGWRTAPENEIIIQRCHEDMCNTSSKKFKKA